MSLIRPAVSGRLIGRWLSGAGSGKTGTAEVEEPLADAVLAGAHVRRSVRQAVFPARCHGA